MNPILHEDYIGQLFGCILFTIILHYVGKWFLKDKLKRKEEFEKFVEENGSIPKMDYNYKKYLMSKSATGYSAIIFAKWMVAIIAFITLYKLMS